MSRFFGDLGPLNGNFEHARGIELYEHTALKLESTASGDASAAID